MVRVRNLISTLLASLLVMALVAPVAWGANLESLFKKLPDEDRHLFRALRVFMTPEEQEVYLTTLKTSAERKDFLVETGYWNKWEELPVEQRQPVLDQKVLPGMDRDALWMTWGKAYKIRKDVQDNFYVDIYYYRWEKEKKGREFISTPDSPSSYKNQSFDRLVYMYNGVVVDVLTEGEDRKPKKPNANETAAPVAPPPVEDTPPPAEASPQ